MKHDFDVQKRIFGVVYYRLFFVVGGVFFMRKWKSVHFDCKSNSSCYV